jgi:hypothetical protein
MRPGMLALVLCASATFLGAALLFAVQPLLAKQLLPWFGGSPSTWAACMVFFQGMLLAGYAYAHALNRWLSRPAQLAAHGLVVAIAVAAAAYACVLRAPSGHGEPPLQIALLLLGQIGASYFVLSATAPLVQRWIAPLLRGEPYVLYALSNAGSLLALLAYPFAVEPYAELQAQFSVWTYAFAGYAALLFCAIACLHLTTARTVSDAPMAAAPAPPSLRRRSHWLACSFLPSVLLLAVTSHITIDVASVPLLWIAPLAIYLLTFIVAFSRLGQRVRGAALALWIATAIGLGFGAFAQGTASLFQQLAVPCLGLFAAGLLCHGELARTRPDPAHLTEYYLLIALGGALGSIAVSWLAPALLDDYYELELSALAIFVVLVLSASTWSRGQRRMAYLGVGICGPLLLASIAVRSQTDSAQGHVLERRRGFLGPLRVVDTREGRLLAHGRIRHGMQLFDARAGGDLVATPTMYFAAGTAVAQVMANHAIDRARSIGIVGLGVGTLASYARAGDSIRFYELDENVVELARRRFTFLSQSAGAVEISIGDGRSLLDRQPPQRFDLLVLDAFSSDAVPVHLLTQQAFAVYARHLAADGVLLANVSNRHLAVERAVHAAAESQGLVYRVVQTEADPALHRERVRWAVMAREPARLTVLLRGLPVSRESEPPVLFTDTRASLLSIVKNATE